jgi:putative ABC transport system substrate-binding protein
MQKASWLRLGVLLLMILAAISAAYWVAVGGGQRPVRIGVLQLTDVDTATFDGFRAGMAELGYAEGTRITYLYQGPAMHMERLEPMIDTLLKAPVDLIYVASTPATQAVQRATAGTGISVVFAPVNDPVKAGIVTSLKMPGGNLTGIRLPVGDALRLAKLTRLVPQIRVIWLPYSANDASAKESLAQASDAAALLKVELRPHPLHDPGEIDEALASIPADVDAIYLPRDSTIESRIKDIVEVAHARRLPLCAPSLTQVEAGALVSYGFVHREIGRQAARLADQVLRGIPPGELPVESARNYLAINLQTAREIGVEIPGDMLRQADILVR